MDTTSVSAGLAPEPMVEGGAAEEPACRLLLAEDDEHNAAPLLDYLTICCGFEVHWARDGREAIALARTVRPELILMDVQMPGMDGLTAMRSLRSDPCPEVRGVPIIALTAMVMGNDAERCRAAGANAHLEKPLSLKVLASMIEAWTGRSVSTEP